MSFSMRTMIAASRPLKRAKLLPHEITNSFSGSGSTPASFFDLFPEDVLLNILRYFSRSPEEEDWVPYVPVESLIELFGVSEGMSKLMQTQFNTFCVASTAKACNETLHWNWEETKNSMLWTDDLAVARRFVVAGGGQSLHTLVIGKRMYDTDMHGTDLVDDFREYCPNVKSLSVEDWAGLWTERFGRQLEHLDAYLAFQKSDIITKFCSNLRKLNIIRAYCTIEFTEDWREIGAKLESLKIQDDCNLLDYCDEDDLRTKFMRVRMLFPNLHSLCFHGMESCNQGIAQLLSSYGGQPKYCHVCNMNERQLKSIKNSCKNAQFSVELSECDLMIPTLNILAERIEKLQICIGIYEELDIDEFKSAWAGCVNIKELVVFHCSIRIAKAILERPLKRLDKILVNGNMRKKIKAILSKATCKVGEFLFMDF